MKPTLATGERRRGGDSGTTLIELLAAFAILGLVTLVVFPAGERALALLSLRQDQAVLAAALRQARAEALTSARPVAFALSPDGGAYAISGGAARPLPAGVAAACDRRTIVFFGDGASTGGAVRLAAAGRILIIIVDPAAGSVRSLG
ncbi:MAG TPA: GspH/FimT family pseudopilin [Caulobacteraceae bacterium]|nr:GspH/FimT family pseudopilin [Caulobacteraceae bacterium]